jgi:hypothetical protein
MNSIVCPKNGALVTYLLVIPRCNDDRNSDYMTRRQLEDYIGLVLRNEMIKLKGWVT